MLSGPTAARDRSPPDRPQIESRREVVCEGEFLAQMMEQVAAKNVGLMFDTQHA